MTDRLHVAEHAKRILEDELTQHALKSIRTGLQDQLWASATRGEINERLNAMAWACDQFERCFLILIQDGALLKEELLMEANAKVKLQEATERAMRYARG